MRLVSLRFVYATLIGLVLAGIVHIAAVLAIPVLSEKDAVSRARTSENLDHPQPIYTIATGDEPSPRGVAADPGPGRGGGRLRLRSRRWADARLRQDRAAVAVARAHARRGAFYAVTDQAACAAAPSTS